MSVNKSTCNLDLLLSPPYKFRNTWNNAKLNHLDNFDMFDICTRTSMSWATFSNTSLDKAFSPTFRQPYFTHPSTRLLNGFACPAVCCHMCGMVSCNCCSLLNDFLNEMRRKRNTIVGIQGTRLRLNNTAVDYDLITLNGFTICSFNHIGGV